MNTEINFNWNLFTKDDIYDIHRQENEVSKNYIIDVYKKFALKVSSVSNIVNNLKDGNSKLNGLIQPFKSTFTRFVDIQFTPIVIQDQYTIYVDELTQQFIDENIDETIEDINANEIINHLKRSRSSFEGVEQPPQQPPQQFPQQFPQQSEKLQHQQQPKIVGKPEVFEFEIKDVDPELIDYMDRIGRGFDTLPTNIVQETPSTEQEYEKEQEVISKPSVGKEEEEEFNPISNENIQGEVFNIQFIDPNEYENLDINFGESKKAFSQLDKYSIDVDYNTSKSTSVKTDDTFAELDKYTINGSLT